MKSYVSPTSCSDYRTIQRLKLWKIAFSWRLARGIRAAFEGVFISLFSCFSHFEKDDLSYERKQKYICPKLLKEAKNYDPTKE
jgi:hypothetical protein